jgi:hypothetical protein
MSRFAGLLDWSGSRKGMIIFSAFMLALGVAIALAARHELTEGKSSSSNDLFATPASRDPPAEYLYLDPARVSAYLSQIENGLSPNELLTLSRTESAEASAGGQVVKIGGTLQSTHSLQATVTPTAASLFYRLKGRLRDKHWLTTADVDKPFSKFRESLFGVEGDSSADGVREGQFVELRNCLLLEPAFARVYSRAAALHLRPRTPALPLSLQVTSSDGKHVDLLFPVAFSGVANASALFSTRLTVVGKLLRKVSPGRRYVDVGSKTAFARVLSKHRRLFARLRLPRDTFTRQFAAAVSVRGPGAVILPIAILK